MGQVVKRSVIKKMQFERHPKTINLTMNILPEDFVLKLNNDRVHLEKLRLSDLGP